MYLTFCHSQDSENVPMMKYLLENGNTTTYQWRTGNKPEVVEEAKIFIDTTDEQDVTENLDDVSVATTYSHIYDKCL